MINNEFYDDLAEGWYSLYDHPIALLRAENHTRAPWIVGEMAKRYPPSASFLDIGCGAGLVSNLIQQAGYQTTGIDLSENSLRTARLFDATKKVNYIKANAYSLPFPDESFDAAAALDILEHVEKPELLIQEASRILKPGGIFFFHTFNRTFLSYLLVIKGVEWCVKNTPKNMHVYSLFIKPSELQSLCIQHRLIPSSLIGLHPHFCSLPFLKMIVQRKVPPNLLFRFSKSLSTGYCGIALKYKESL